MSGKENQDYVLGIDFGTDSVRALVVDAADGSSAGTAVSAYKRWAKGEFCDPKSNRFRQHPLDYVEGIEDATKRAEAMQLAPLGSLSPGKRPGVIEVLTMTAASAPEAALVSDPRPTVRWRARA